jgi:hypothetical protein
MLGMNEFIIGQQISIKVRHTSNVLGVGQEILDFVGTIVESPKWLGTDYISVYTNNSEYPTSHIKKTNIVDYSSAKVDTRVDTRVFRVRSKSKNSSYNVIISDKGTTCDCIGFQFRGKCKHSEAVMNFIKSN